MNPRIGALRAPRSIAIVGANDKGNAGARLISLARKLGFSGALYPVNAKHDRVEGIACFPSLSSLPETPDVVAIAAPGHAVVAVAEEAQRLRASAMIVFANGFLEANSAEGRARHERLAAIAQESGCAILGPNCMGLLSLKRRMNASFIALPEGMRAGDISVVSQSGGLINALVELATARGVGFDYLVSTGNESFLGAADHLEALADDPETKVVISILESVRDGARFRAALAGASRKKPVIVLKLGRTKAGRRATVAHTGAFAGSDQVFSAVCDECGAILAETLDEALETAALLAKAPQPSGERAVIFSTSGGATALTTDIGSKAGLVFPPLGAESNARLQCLFGAAQPFINPFDVGGAPLLFKDRTMSDCLDILVGDPQVDLVACVLVMSRDPSARRENLVEQTKAFAEDSPKPILLLPEATLHWRETPPDAGRAHVAADLKNGLLAIRHLFAYWRFRRTPERETASHAPLRSPTLERPANRASLMEFEAKAALAAAGVPIAREALTRTADEAVEAARRLGFPVALKIQAPELVHKTEVGGVALGLNNPDSVRRSFEHLRRRGVSSGVSEPVCCLVQEMIEGVEIFVGMKRDPVFGPVLTFGAGGLFVELINDVSIALAPMDAGSVERLMRGSRAANLLLEGHRGSPPADRPALAALIGAFARFVSEAGHEIEAIDLNPVIVGARGQGARVVDASIIFAQADPSGCAC